MKLTIEVVSLGHTKQFREQATRIFFNRLPAYSFWIKGAYQVLDEQIKVKHEGRIQSLGKHNREYGCFAGLDHLVGNNHQELSMPDSQQRLRLCQLLPDYFADGYLIKLNVCDSRYVLNTDHDFVHFNFRDFLTRNSFTKGENKIAIF